MNKAYILPFFAAAILATGCSKEEPFGSEADGMGQLLKSAISVDLSEGLQIRKSRADIDVDVNEFNVIFTSEDGDQPVIKYKYGEMPEVVTLPSGHYTCTATYGQNLNAEWDSPYFLGQSESFEIKPLEITSYVDPIECALENIKVTVDFDKALREHMSPTSTVEVKVGQSTALLYGVGEADSQKAGYFMHSNEITLVAVFNGEVDGATIIESKSMKDIKKGAHYKINFKLHSSSDSNVSGDVEIDDFTVDATVEVEDVNRNVSLGEEELLDDNERPQNGEEPGSGDEEPDDPQPGPGEDPTGSAPTITADSPVQLDVVNDGDNIDSCVIRIHSDAEGGIEVLKCVIDSEGLTEEDLEGLDLAKELDLVNTPASMEESLNELGFPTKVGKQKDVELVLTPFIELLGALGPYSHSFILTVKDANGQCTRTLTIKYN